MAKHQIVHIELAAKDRKKSGKFYADLFGWQVEQDDLSNYAVFDTGQPDLRGGFNPVSDDNPAGTVLIYIESDDIDADLQKIEKAGGKTILAKTIIPQTGWFGIFEDPGGNRVGLYTHMPRA